VFVVSAVWCAPALGQHEIVIQPADGGTPVTVPFEEVEGTIGRNGEIFYPVRRKPGTGYNPQRIRNGASLAEVIVKARELGLRGSYRYIDIVRSAGDGFVRLSKKQISTGNQPPVVWVDEIGRLNLLRASTGPNDLNFRDHVKSSGSLHLAQTNEDALDVLLRCRPDKPIKAGDKVTCTAKVTGGGLGDRYRFRWDFGDGDIEVRSVQRNQHTMPHTYEEDGDFDITVTVRTNGDSTEPPGPAEVDVEPGESQETDTTGSGGAGTGTSTGSAGTTGSYGSTSTPSPTTPTPSTPSAPTPLPTPPATSLGASVAGNLLADISTPASPADASAAQAAKSGTATFEPPDSGGVVPAAVWAGLGALLLMTAGAGLESGHRPRLRLPHLPRILRR